MAARRLRRPRHLGPLLALIVLAAAGLSGCGGAQRHATGSRTTSVRGRDASYRDDGRLAALRLWVNPDTPATAQIRIWRSRHDGRQAAALEPIARRATAVWLTTNADPGALVAQTVDAAARGRAVAQLVLYDIPDRDCHSYSAGGADGPQSYLRWVGEVEQSLAGHPVILVIEPDALDQAASGQCMSTAQARARDALMAQAVTILRRDRAAHIYIDAGHADWLSTSQIAPALRQAGVAHAAGFSLNVANFETTAASIAYGDALSRLLGGAHFVIDTSRNGDGPPPAAGGATASWCNPTGRRIGAAPTTRTGHPLVDAYLWVKYPGESDGSCAPGEPPAGTWWPSYALGLVSGR